MLYYCYTNKLNISIESRENIPRMKIVKSFQLLKSDRITLFLSVNLKFMLKTCFIFSFFARAKSIEKSWMMRSRIKSTYYRLKYDV